MGTNIYTNSVHVTALLKCLGIYIANKKTVILVGTGLEVEVGPKATALGKRWTFDLEKFDLGGADMKVDTINIRSVKLHTSEPICTATGGDSKYRDNSSITTTNGDTTIIYPVSI